MTENAVGATRDYQVEPEYLEIPNLVLTTAESRAQTFYDWHQSFVVEGNNSASQEKSGTLEYLTSDMKQVLFTLTLSNLGIFRLTRDRREAASENIRRVKAEMYCERMTFAYGEVATGTAAATAPAAGAQPASGTAPLSAPARSPVTAPPEEIRSLARTLSTLRFRS